MLDQKCAVYGLGSETKMCSDECNKNWESENMVGYCNRNEYCECVSLDYLRQLHTLIHSKKQ